MDWVDAACLASYALVILFAILAFFCGRPLLERPQKEPLHRSASALARRRR